MSPNSVSLCQKRRDGKVNPLSHDDEVDLLVNDPPETPKASAPFTAIDGESSLGSSSSDSNPMGYMTAPPVPVISPGETEQGDHPEGDASNEVSTSITQTWTDQAIKCYKTNADCDSCSIPAGNYSFDCQMNKVVPVLVKNLGEPDIHRVKKLLPFIHHYQ